MEQTTLKERAVRMTARQKKELLDREQRYLDAEELKLAVFIIGEELKTSADTRKGLTRKYLAEQRRRGIR